MDISILIQLSTLFQKVSPNERKMHQPDGRHLKYIMNKDGIRSY